MKLAIEVPDTIVALCVTTVWNDTEKNCFAVSPFAYGTSDFHDGAELKAIVKKEKKADDKA